MFKKIIVLLVAAVFAVSGGLFSCAQKSEQADKTIPVENMQKKGEENPLNEKLDGAFEGNPLSPKSAEIKPENYPEVVAVINGTEISRDQFVKMLNNVKMNVEMRGQLLTEDRLKELAPRVLDNMINTELLEKEAKAGNVVVDEEKVRESVEKIKKQHGSEEAFNKFISSRDLEVGEMEGDIRRGILINTFFEEQVFSAIKISDKKVKEHYKENKVRYSTPEQVKARHILIKLPDSAEKEVVKEAEKRLDEIAQKYRDGETFEDLAKQYSEGPSAERGGDLGFFRRGAMVQSFEEAAFSLKPGEVSDPVRTQFGLHLIKVEEKKKASVASLEEVKPQIILSLESGQKRELANKYIAKIREKADLKINL